MESSSWYLAGALLGGMLALATLVTTRSQSPTLYAHPAPLVTLPPMHAPLSSGLSTGASRGIAPSVAAALVKAVPSPLPSEPTSDAVALTLSPETTDRLAHTAVDAINGAGDVTLHFIAAGDALVMASGLTRVTFTAYDTPSNTAIKLVAFFDKNMLRLVRPYSAAGSGELEGPIPFERAYARYDAMEMATAALGTVKA